MLEEPTIAWAGPVCVSWWKKQGLLTLEAYGLRNGERHVTRSFTLRGVDLARSPSVVRLIRDALDDVETMELEADDEN